MTIEQDYEAAFLRRAQIDDLLVQNQSDIERLTEDRKSLRGEREKLSQAIERLKVAKTIQTHEEAAAEARAKAEAARSEADKALTEIQATSKAQADELAAKHKLADELIAKLQAQVESAKSE